MVLHRLTPTYSVPKVMLCLQVLEPPASYLWQYHLNTAHDQHFQLHEQLHKILPMCRQLTHLTVSQMPGLPVRGWHQRQHHPCNHRHLGLGQAVAQVLGQLSAQALVQVSAQELVLALVEVSTQALVQASGQLLVLALVQVSAALILCTMAPGMSLGVPHNTAHSQPGCTKH